MDQNNHNTPAYQFKYVQLETVDTFHDDYIEFKKYINVILKSLDFNKNFDDNPNLVKTNSDANSMKHLEEKINEMQVENKHLKDDVAFS